MIYLDTSVLAPFYWIEAMSNSVTELFQQSQTLIISELSEVELMFALSRRVRMKEIEREDAIAIVNQFQMHITSGTRSKCSQPQCQRTTSDPIADDRRSV